jgi:transketolase
VAEFLSIKRPVPLRILGVPGEFAPTGSHGWLCEHFGLTPEGVRAAVLELLRGK